MKQHKDNYLYGPIMGNFLSWFVAFVIMSFYVNGYVDSPWVMVIGLLTRSIWTLWLHGYREAERIEIKKQRINHNSRFVVRSSVCIFIGLATHILADGFTNAAYLRAGAAALYLATIIWLLFDSFLSVQRGKRWDYITAVISGAPLSDRIFYNHKWMWVISKIVFFVAGACLYFYVLVITS